MRAAREQLELSPCHAERHPGDLLRCACSDVPDGGSRMWLGRKDSNLRMREPKSRALPLGHAPPCETPLRAHLQAAGRPRGGCSASRSTAVSPTCPALRRTGGGRPKGSCYRRDPTSRRKPIAYTYLRLRASLRRPSPCSTTGRGPDIIRPWLVRSRWIFRPFVLVVARRCASRAAATAPSSRRRRHRRFLHRRRARANTAPVVTSLTAQGTRRRRTGQPRRRQRRVGRDRSGDRRRDAGRSPDVRMVFAPRDVHGPGPDRPLASARDRAVAARRDAAAAWWSTATSVSSGRWRSGSIDHVREVGDMAPSS